MHADLPLMVLVLSLFSLTILILLRENGFTLLKAIGLSLLYVTTMLLAAVLLNLVITPMWQGHGRSF